MVEDFPKRKGKNKKKVCEVTLSRGGHPNLKKKLYDKKVIFYI